MKIVKVGDSVYLPFKGHTIYGEGKVLKSDKSNFKWRFKNEHGTVYFNSFQDYHVKDAYVKINQ